jgi:hypothetical protein
MWGCRDNAVMKLRERERERERERRENLAGEFGSNFKSIHILLNGILPRQEAIRA